jgi:hypothetical protein
MMIARTGMLAVMIGGWLAAGCAVAPGEARKPAFEQRLSEVERERLAATPRPVPSTRGTAGSTNRFALTPSIHHGTTVGERWWVEDDPPHVLLDWAGGETVLDNEAPIALTAEDRERLYARRPPLPGFSETVKRDVKHMGADLWRDTKRVYANPVNLAILGVSYGGALAVQQTGPDRTVEHSIRRGKRVMSSDWADAFGAMGNPGTHFGLAGLMYLVGQQAQDEKTYEVSKALFSALIVNGLSVLAGQAATWDRSPNGERGTFPSGHTSSTFALATVMNEAYGPLAGVPLYGLGVFVGIERIQDREHYMSDVLFGAVLGTVVGHAIASGRDPEFFGWKILPYADPAAGSSGVALVKSFK